MNNEQRTNKAFTLIELVVAIAILAMVLSFSSVIFKVSIAGYRTASANAETMQKLRATTNQLNADFKGIRADAPLLIWFHQDATDPSQRYDQILFFADGDFQSTQLYDGGAANKVPADTGEPVIGNLARIHYAQAQIPDPNGFRSKEPFEQDEENRILARRRHILTADPQLDEWPKADMSDFDEINAGYKNNERYEHDRLSLSQWKTVDGSNYDGSGKVIDVCFTFRPEIDMDDPNTFHKLMCSGVGSFAIQWAYWDSAAQKFYWFPSDDPAGDGSATSHFDLMADEFGVFFNIPNGSGFGDWYSINDAAFSGQDFSSYPKALKFTFTLYDSKGVMKRGREFTHIVYLGN